MTEAYSREELSRAHPNNMDVWCVEGYWRQTEDDPEDLPWPVPEPGWGEQEFLLTLKEVERIAPWQGYRGMSTSRLTGLPNGSREYYHKGWIWPEGLAHYIERGVKPSDAFRDFISREYGLIP
jgi:hypothetical protein